MKLNVVLAAVERDLADAWQRLCGDLPGVTVHRGSIFDLPCEAVVSPSNSFGFMDGGIDYLYSKRFGWHVQQRLQDLIRSEHHGELLVGQAEIIPTDDASIPFVIAAPTMRVPLVLRESVNPYLAARATFLLIKHRAFRDGPWAGKAVASIVRTVAFPGLGTGCGQIAPEICAGQLRAAFEEVLLGQQTFPQSWRDAQERHVLHHTSR